MTYAITVRQVTPETIAAVRRRMRAVDIPKGFNEPLDKVWELLRRHPELREGGHNLFLYRLDIDESGAMTIDFGVQVTRGFDQDGEVAAVMTPAGEVASTVHRGPYSGLRDAHRALHEWLAQSGRKSGGWSWEIYGDWTSDPAKLETEVVYLLE